MIGETLRSSFERPAPTVAELGAALQPFPGQTIGSDFDRVLADSVAAWAETAFGI